MILIRPAAFFATSLALAPAALAHHGFGSFDRGTEITISGVVTGVDFVNPHSWVYLDVHDGDEVESWRCEMRAATVLRRSGWSADMFPEGAEITITGAPDRNDPSSCYLSTVELADGRSADRYGQLREASEPEPVERALRLESGEPNISGDWAPEQLVMTDPRGREGALVPLSSVEQYEAGERPDGGPRGFRPQVELTEVGEHAAGIFDTYSDDNPRMRCETTSILFDWTFDGPINRITQDEDRITLQYGQLGFTRTIRMDLSEHPEDIEPSRAGHSIGRWEDDVLIVDTVGFEPGVLSPPVLHGSNLHVVERFSLDPETLALTRRYTAEDPVYFEGQYTGMDTIYPADLPYGPDECEELTFVDYSEQSRQAGADAEASPWWRFWD